MSLMTKVIMLVLAHRYEQNKKKRELLAWLKFRRTIRRRFYLTKKDLVSPKESGWRHLFSCGSDDAFQEFLGCPRNIFCTMAKQFADFYTYGKRRRDGAMRWGRKSLLSVEDALGLVLMALRSPCRRKMLSVVFGATPTVISMTVKHALDALDRMLMQTADAKIKWPNVETMKEYAQMIALKQPILQNVFGFVDGLNLPIRQPGDCDEQETYYNSWLQGCFASPVIVFAPDGTIIWIRYNFPGSFC